MMSQKQIQEQHDTINVIAKQLRMIVKYWPVFALAGGLVISIGTGAITGYKYEQSLVKQTEFIKAVKIIDALSVKLEISQKNRTIDSTKLDQVSESVSEIKARLDKRSTGYVTAKRDRFGRVTFNSIN